MAERDNLSVVQHGINDLRLEQTPLPKSPAPNEVQLMTHTVGICGSDVRILQYGKCSGEISQTTPMICGHESSAIIVSVGDNVKNLKVGDRVAVEPAVPCSQCDICKEGAYNLCPHIICQAAPPYDGCLRKYYNHNSDFCHKIPNQISFGEGALIEPLAVAVHACRRANISEESKPNVLVTGAGPIGILCALTAKALGAIDVCIIDINESRLQFAKQMGIEKTLLVTKRDDEMSISDRIRQTLGQSPHITIECTGAEFCMNLAIEVTRFGGNIIMVGFNPDKINVKLTKASDREINLIGNKRYKNSFPLAVSLVANRRVNVKPLISKVYDMKDSISAFETAKSCADGIIKVQIICHSD